MQVRLYQQTLKNLIERGKAKPNFVFDGEYKIEDATNAFKDFSEHKVVKAIFSFEKAAEMGRERKTILSRVQEKEGDKRKSWVQRPQTSRQYQIFYGDLPYAFEITRTYDHRILGSHRVFFYNRALESCKLLIWSFKRSGCFSELGDLDVASMLLIRNHVLLFPNLP